MSPATGIEKFVFALMKIKIPKVNLKKMQIFFEYEFSSVQAACASRPGGPGTLGQSALAQLEQRFLEVAFDLNPKGNPQIGRAHV